MPDVNVNASQAQAQDPAAQTQQPVQPAANETFETWLEKQDDTVKDLYSAHTTGLRSALDSERAASKAAQAQLRELAKKAEKGSELETALNQQIEKLSALEKQSAFQDKAHAAGVRNLKLAYLAAAQAGLVGEKGECDFAKLRTEYPELFASAPAPAPANAGNGTGGATPGKVDMNQAIRQALGR